VNTEQESTPSRRRPKLGRLAIGIVLVAAALGYLVYAGTKDNLVYYYEVDEVQAAAAKTGGKVRISGDVVEGSIVRNEQSRAIHFSIRGTAAEGGSAATIPVVYAGTVPDIFREGIQVVVEGRIGEDGTFEAETLLAKCPSKYQEAGQLSADPASSGRS
jgi:cytochrome c-type biogenesis protein CcmE